MKTDYFSVRKAAEYYAKGRPYVHDEVMQRVRTFLNLKVPVARALDIGCGTGLSAVALKEVSHSIVALDISNDMIAVAPRDQHISYVNAVAEYLPLTTASFDIATASSAFHWFVKKQFIKELSRVLKPCGSAIIYENHLTAQQEECPEFKQWYYEVFNKRYPRPPRDYTFDIKELKKNGLGFLGEESFEKTVQFTAEQLTNHLLSLTHVISAVENGKETYSSVGNWLQVELKQFQVLRSKKTSSGKRGFSFAGTLQYFQKQNP